MKRLVPAVVLLLLPLLAAPAPAAPATSGPPAPRSVTVTLITGDQVTMTGPVIDVVPARKRKVTFHTTRIGTVTRVVPSDVAHLVGNVLDPSLFDVAALATSPGVLPVIVSGAPALRGAASARALPSINAVAVELPISEAAATVLPLDLSATSAASGLRIWLDAPVAATGGATLAAAGSSSATLAAAGSPGATQGGTLPGAAFREAAPDAGGGQAAGRGAAWNLEQIEAPAAWDQGLTGAGVKVAVLDTGVDAGHPDLAGRVVAEMNFSESPFATDQHGHGTHVASVLAGRKGVAFGASLISGKVLDDDGFGRFSDIIAGMEWAAASGARVVNMSLGSDSASDGTDPVSLAVDSLTKAHGTLFVASAGNRGPNRSTVGAPGAATEALAVGAVDRRDRLADFSSRGPRLGDRAIKPEIAAPGVDIIGARATDTDLGEPVNNRYTKLSGTSMAAPHVAGAAALLAQRHPLWTAGNLRAALIGSADAIDAGAFDAGSGRVDAANAARQRLLATPATAGFGFAAFPQTATPPIQRTVTFTNTGTQPMTVDLAAHIAATAATDPATQASADTAATDPPTQASAATAATDLVTQASAAAMQGAPGAQPFSVSPRRLTVPAGGQANATVTVDVTRGGFGPLSGTLRAGRDVLRVPLGIVKEEPHYLLHINAVDRLGSSENIETLAWLVNLADISSSPPDPVLLLGGRGTVRVKAGHYLVTAAIPTLEEGDPPGEDGAGTDDLIVTSVAIATIAEVAVNGETTVGLDAALAVPLTASVAGADTTPVDVHVFIAAVDRQDNRSILAYATSALDVIEGKLFVQPTTPTRRGTIELSSKWRLDTVGGGPTYDLLFADDAFPRSLDYVAQPRDLATIRTTYRAAALPVWYLEGRFVHTTVNPVSIAVPQPAPIAPATRTELVSAARDRDWFQCVNVLSGEEGIGSYCQAPQEYRARSTHSDAWLQAPLRTRAGMFRSNTRMFFAMDDLGESGPHGGTIGGFAFTHRAFALYRNGELVSEGIDPLGGHRMPKGPASFRLERTLELRPDLLGISARVATTWTFTTQMLDVAVNVPLDENNRAPAGTPIAVAVDGPRASLEVSADDGATWTAVPLRQGRGLLLLPAGPVSLRTKGSDGLGNSVEQVVIRAFYAA